MCLKDVTSAERTARAPLEAGSDALVKGLSQPSRRSPTAEPPPDVRDRALPALARGSAKHGPQATDSRLV